VKNVNVAGTIGRFTVRPFSQPQDGLRINWWLVGGYIAVAVAGAVVFSLTVKRRVM
jgi:hypothetical protein